MSQIKVIVPKDSVINGTGRASGKAFSMQTLGLVQDNGLCQEFKRFLRDPSDALPPGNYVVTVEKAYVDKTGNLAFNTTYNKV